MPRARWTLSLLALLLASLACAVANPLTSVGDSLNQTSDLWSDVPRMDGLTASDSDMPVVAKVIVRTVVSNILSEGTGSGDWILFRTDKTAEDVQAYYTNERMAENGWEASEASTCVSGAAEGITGAGLLCVFQKQSGSQYTGLAIIGTQDEATQQTNLIFVRIEADQTPEPAGP